MGGWVAAPSSTRGGGGPTFLACSCSLRPPQCHPSPCALSIYLSPLPPPLQTWAAGALPLCVCAGLSVLRAQGGAPARSGGTTFVDRRRRGEGGEAGRCLQSLSSLRTSTPPRNSGRKTSNDHQCRLARVHNPSSRRPAPPSPPRRRDPHRPPAGRRGRRRRWLGEHRGRRVRTAGPRARPRRWRGGGGRRRASGRAAVRGRGATPRRRRRGCAEAGAARGCRTGRPAAPAGGRSAAPAGCRSTSPPPRSAFPGPGRPVVASGRSGTGGRRSWAGRDEEQARGGRARGRLLC